MAAPNKMPAGSRPGPAKPNEHAPFKGGTPMDGHSNPPSTGNPGVAPHGTPKPVGAGKKNPLK